MMGLTENYTDGTNREPDFDQRSQRNQRLDGGRVMKIESS